MTEATCLHRRGFRFFFHDGKPKDYVQCVTCYKLLGPDDGYILTWEHHATSYDMPISWVEIGYE